MNLVHFILGYVLIVIQTIYLSYFTFKFQEDHKKLDKVDWEKWFYGVGMPPYQPKYV